MTKDQVVVKSPPSPPPPPPPDTRTVDVSFKRPRYHPYFLKLAPFISIIVLLLGLATATYLVKQRQQPAVPAADIIPIHIPPIKKVLVINFNPVLENQSGQTLIQYANWNNPPSLETQYLHHLQSASDSSLDYQVVSRLDIDDFPIKADGFRYTDSSYLACLTNSSSCHQPDGANYLRILSDHDVCGRVNRGEIDELWLWGGPYFGFWEAVMAGPGAFRTNAPPITGSTCQRPLHIMGFNYERGVAEMLEDFAHRVEGTMIYIYGSWDPIETHDWNRFTLLDKDAPGRSGCGNAHDGPNGMGGYDRTNPRFVWSFCEDWLNYPNLTGQQTSVSCTNWGCTAESYLVWWLSHLPRPWWQSVINGPPPSSPTPQPSPSAPAVFPTPSPTEIPPSPVTFPWATVILAGLAIAGVSALIIYLLRHKTSL